MLVQESFRGPSGLIHRVLCEGGPPIFLTGVDAPDFLQSGKRYLDKGRFPILRLVALEGFHTQVFHWEFRDRGVVDFPVGHSVLSHFEAWPKAAPSAVSEAQLAFQTHCLELPEILSGDCAAWGIEAPSWKCRDGQNGGLDAHLRTSLRRDGQELLIEFVPTCENSGFGYLVGVIANGVALEPASSLEEAFAQCWSQPRLGVIKEMLALIPILREWEKESESALQSRAFYQRQGHSRLEAMKRASANRGVAAARVKSEWEHFFGADLVDACLTVGSVTKAAAAVRGDLGLGHFIEVAKKQQHLLDQSLEGTRKRTPKSRR